MNNSVFLVIILKIDIQNKGETDEDYTGKWRKFRNKRRQEFN